MEGRPAVVGSHGSLPSLLAMPDASGGPVPGRWDFVSFLCLTTGTSDYGGGTSDLQRSLVLRLGFCASRSSLWCGGTPV